MGMGGLYDDMRPDRTPLRRWAWQFISLSNSKVIFAKLIRDSGCTNDFVLWNVDRVVKKESKAFFSGSRQIEADFSRGPRRL